MPQSRLWMESELLIPCPGNHAGSFDASKRQGQRHTPIRSNVLRNPCEYLWENDFGQVHTVSQGESGEQNDALMHFKLHSSITELWKRQPEHCVQVSSCSPSLMMSTSSRHPTALEPFTPPSKKHCGTCAHCHPLGRTKVWNVPGIRPEICTVLERMARETDRTARVWWGSEVPEDEQGMKVLGTPLEHPQYVRRFLSQLSEKHKVLLRRIPRLDDVQSAWLLFARCAAFRATYSLRWWNHKTLNLARAHMNCRCGSASVPFSKSIWKRQTRKRRILCHCFGHWGVGAQECSTGQLGRLFGHDQRTPPRSRSIDGGRVGRRPSNVMLGSSGFSGKGVDRSVRF